MLFRGSFFLSAALVVCASVVGVSVAVSSAGAENRQAMVSKHAPDFPPPDRSGASGASGEIAPQATVEERVALFKARLEEWGTPARPNRLRRTPVVWRTSAARSKSAIAPATAPVFPLLAAATVGAQPDSLATLRASGDQHCLATAIYYEARNQPVEGQEAVGQVIMNRVGKPQFSDSVCGVVVQGGERRGCQFSFVCDGSMNRPPRDATAWAMAEDVASRTLRGEVTSSVGGATFYHANYVSPWWSKVLPRVAQIGAHIFYSGFDTSASRMLREVPLLGRSAALVGDRVGHSFDAPLLPGGFLGGA
jgi:hypothetical protein